MTVRWRGRQVLAATRRAQIMGVNVTMEEAVTNAQSGHKVQTKKRWQSRSFPGLETSTKITTFARPTRRGVSGIWGSADIIYALAQELGSPKQSVPARPYLRPAADAEYPALARNIRGAMA